MQEVIGPVNVTGSGDIGGLAILHPIVRQQAWSLFAYAGFDISNLENQSATEAENVTTQDRLRVVSVGATLNTVDAWRGVSALSITVYQGLGSVLGGLESDDDPDASRPGAGGTFTKLVGQVSRLQRIWGPLSLYVRAAGQWASTDLVAAEQFFLGGVGTVRGYALAQFAGDNGYALTGEVRLAAPVFSNLVAFLGRTWGDILQLHGFVDTGWAWLGQPLPDEPKSQQLTSVGGGLTVSVADNFLLNVEYARPVVPTSDGRRRRLLSGRQVFLGGRAMDALRTSWRAWLASVVAWLIAAGPVAALPQGAQVVSGKAVVSQPNPATLQIMQVGGPVVIQWRAFSIGSGELVRFVQPGSASLAGNRVTGGSASVILGQLLANGQIALINPAGVSVGPAASSAWPASSRRPSSFGRPTCSPGASSSSKARAASPRS